jgi:hypothetical protein
MQTAEGREALEALLQKTERGRGQEDITAEANRRGILRAKELLGLDAP